MTTGKPTIAVLYLAAEWFWNMNIQSGEAERYRELPAQVGRDMAAITQALSETAEVIDLGLVYAVPQARGAADALRQQRCDLLLIVSLIWSEDAPLIALLQEVTDLPLLYWCYAPGEPLPAMVSTGELFRRSGPVGAVQHSGLLKRLGRTFDTVVGPATAPVLAQIACHARAARLVRALRSVTIGLLPGRCDCMTGTWVDESRLLRLGPRVQPISVAEYAAVARAIDDAAVTAYLDGLRARCPVREVGEESLRAAARASLGLAQLADDRRLDAIAIDDLAAELHAVMGIRPCLSAPGFFAAGRVITMEADLAAAVAMLLVRGMCDAPPMYTEFFTFDESRNAVLAGHAGMHDLALADTSGPVAIVPDYEYCESNALEGAWMEFRAKPGRVTMISLFDDLDGFKMVIAGGESLADGPRLQGFAHMLIRLDVPVADFFARAMRTGITQHWAIVHDAIQERMRALAGLLGIAVKCIE